MNELIENLGNKLPQTKMTCSEKIKKDKEVVAI